MMEEHNNNARKGCEHIGGHRHHRPDRGYEQEDLAGKLEFCARALARFAGRHHGQRKILRILKERSPISQKELQSILGIQSGSMSEIAAKLERKGMIVRGRDQADKRKITLSITEAGLEWLVQRNDAEIQRRRVTFFAALTQEEQNTLEALLDKLAVSWEQRRESESQEDS